MHHPFTMPMEEDIPYLDTDLGKVRAKAYDIVLNGTELGGGSVRIHQTDIQEKMFEALGFTQEQACLLYTSFIVDPGGDALKISTNVSDMEMTPKAILLTHGHYDHIAAVDALKKRYNIPVIASEAEDMLLVNQRANLSVMFGEDVYKRQVYKRLSGCGSGTEYLAVTPWGDFYPCHQFVGDEDFLMGNVDEGLSLIHI